MARYGKTVKLICDLVRKFEDKYNGVEGGVAYKRKGDAVYEIKGRGKFITLVHYGTDICVIDRSDRVLRSVGGWSNTDRDAINTFLDEYDINKVLIGRKVEERIYPFPFVRRLRDDIFIES